MVFNFHVNQYVHLALVRRHADPVRKALTSLPSIPENCQWANFLTNHDELTLDQLTESERQEVFEAFAPDEGMRLFGRGIRRRLPSMLGGDEGRLRLAYSVLFSLPGCPVLFYGEEIGMGENLEIEGRRAVRSPMQWSPRRNGGFSGASPDELIRPITNGQFGPKNVNAEEQVGRSGSMFDWMQRLVRRRRELPEFGLGEYRLLEVDRPEVLALRFDWEGRTVVTLHNFSGDELEVGVGLDMDGSQAVELWSDSDYDDSANSPFFLMGNGFRWFKWGVGQDWSL